MRHMHRVAVAEAGPRRAGGGLRQDPGRFAAGPMALAGPTGGFLLGFVPAAALAGWLASRGWAAGAWRSGAMFLAGHAVLFAGGIAWLSTLIGFEHAIPLGLLPFLPGTVVKVALGTALLAALRTGRRG